MQQIKHCYGIRKMHFPHGEVCYEAIINREEMLIYLLRESLQVAITIGTGTGKWATWAICFIFVINSAANCVMLLLFSPSLR